MKIANWEATPELSALYQEVRRLDLEENIVELDAYGFTVVPPEKVAPPEFVDRLYATITAIAEAQAAEGINVDIEAVEVFARAKGNTGHTVFYLLFEDPIFEEALMNPAQVALITYLLGESCLLSSNTAMLKRPGNMSVGLHCDSGHVPSPFPSYAQVANSTWALTDYSKDGGALYFVPGSHKLCRSPRPNEYLDADGDDLRVAVEAPKGSLIIWHGNTWHGAFEKVTPGVRVNLIYFFCRLYLKTSEAYGENVTAAMLARNPERFARLTGKYASSGWKRDGPDYEKWAYLHHAAASKHR